jgi:hypothetical protein
MQRPVRLSKDLKHPDMSKQNYSADFSENSFWQEVAAALCVVTAHVEPKYKKLAKSTVDEWFS